MKRLTERLSALKSAGRKALSLYVTAGYPTPDSTVPLVLALSSSGADIIELGVPFSDPIADGPVIQHSSEIALKNGMTLTKSISIASEIRKQSEVPIILMGYTNPIYAFGATRFVQQCSSSGIDGVIVPDLPPEESRDFRAIASQHHLASILLAAPTTTDERLIQLDNDSTGFLYCVSLTGVTGERAGIANEAAAFIQRARSRVRKNPLLVGFGISTPDDARRVSSYCDGIIIGSALIKLLNSHSQDTMIQRAGEFTRNMRIALDT